MGDFLRDQYAKLDLEKESFFKEKGPAAYVKKYGRYLPNGKEVCDPTPMAIPVGCRKPLTLQEQLARLTPIAAYNLSRQWSDGDEEEDDLLDPEDCEDAALLAQIRAKKAPQGSKKKAAATKVADDSESDAQEPEDGEEPDSE